jgi:hypothetical protein
MKRPVGSNVLARGAARGARRTWCAAVAITLCGPACRTAPETVADAAPDSGVQAATGYAAPTAPQRGGEAGGAKVLVLDAPAEGSVDAIVRGALAAAAGAAGGSRTLVVYVGAAWCEPCRRFHEAAARGDLDAELPRLTLLGFDLDRDRDRLAAAGYVSKYIPLFALPTPTGAASGKQIEGGIKGDGAVGFIVPRLSAMLAE